MKRIIFFLMLGITAGVMAAESLLPKLDPATMDNEATGWTFMRTADAVAEHNVDFAASTCELKLKSASGYAYYYCFAALPPGEYTFAVTVSGQCEKADLGVEIYSFDQAGKPNFVVNYKAEPGRFEDEVMTQTFTIPADSVKIRFGLCLNSLGTATFVKPVLTAKAEAPDVAAVPSAAETAPDSQEGWHAEWIWLKERNIPKATFRRTFELAELPASAYIQLTADNSYQLRVNGEFVNADDDWRTVEKFDVKKLLKPGENTIELLVNNFDDVGGGLLQMEYFAADGTRTVIATDDAWDVVIDGKVRNELKKLQGKVPVVPWGKVPYAHVRPPMVSALPLKRMLPEVPAGKTFSLTFGGAAELKEGELAKPELKFFTEEGNPVAISHFANPKVRRHNGTLWVEMPVARFAMPGTYTWTLTMGNREIVPKGNVSRAFKVLPYKGELSQVPLVRIPRYDGKEYVETAVGKKPLFTYSDYVLNVENFYNWVHTGGIFYEAYAFSSVVVNENEYDFSAMERTMLEILEAEPNASIVIKLRVDTPGWWGAKHPDDIFLSNKGRGALQSFCSEAWRERTRKTIVDLLSYFEARPAGKRISGMILMGYRGGEFQLWGEDMGEYDCSPVAKTAFAEYQKAKGITPEITLPHPALEYPWQPGEGFDKVRQIYFTFVAERHAQNLIDFAKFFKEKYKDRYTIGFYFGYPCEHCDFNRLLLSGHIGYERLLREAPIDYISCPASYALRGANRSHAFMNSPGAAARHGIRSILENDVRTCFFTPAGDSAGPTIMSLHDSIENDSRISFFAATQGAFLRYLSLDDKDEFFSHFEMLNSIRDDGELAMQIRPVKPGAPGQFALAIDPMSWVKAPDARIDAAIWTDFTSTLRDTVMRTGRPVTFVGVDDLIETNGMWKDAVIPWPGLLPESKVKALEALYGKLPIFKPATPALLILDGKAETVSSLMELWEKAATPEAQKAGVDTVWYVAENATATWDGKEFKILELKK